MLRGCFAAFFMVTGGAALAADMPPGSGMAGSDSGSGGDQKSQFLRVGSLGDVSWVDTFNPGRFHFAGKLGVDTADYSRGAFDGVPQDLDRLSPEVGLVGTVELLRDPSGPITSLALIAGTDDNFADTPSVALNDGWYETNEYVAVAAAFSPGFIAGVTHSWFGSVDNDGDVDFSRQITVSGRYTGDGFLGKELKPQLKVSSVLDGDGLFFGADIAPSFKLAEASSVSFSVPLELGVGTDDYYGKNTGTGVYGSAGLFASVPLESMPKSYGSWTFETGGKVVIRDDTIAKAGRPFDDAENAVFIGSASLNFAY